MRCSILSLALVATQAIAAPAISYDKHLRVRSPISSRQDDHALNRQRADAVKAAFTFAWDGYYKYCKGQDEYAITFVVDSRPHLNCNVDCSLSRILVTTQETTGELPLWTP